LFFELTECRRTGTIEEYSNRFQELLTRAGRMDEEQCIQLYTGGLLLPLSHVVQILNPGTLNAAMSLAQQVEQMELTKIQAPAKPGARGHHHGQRSQRHKSLWRCQHRRWAQHRSVARALGAYLQRRWQIGAAKACVLTVTRSILVATTVFAGASSLWMAWRSMRPWTRR
jgi:hypothetical protein